MRLRAAHALDAGAVGAILDAFARETAWMPKDTSGAEAIAYAGKMIDLGWVRVAEAEGQVLGFVARNQCEVNALYVAAEARGLGVGQALLAEAKAEATQLELWAHQANTLARGFYLAQGFVEVETSAGARNDEKLPDVRLVWQGSKTEKAA